MPALWQGRVTALGVVAMLVVAIVGPFIGAWSQRRWGK